MKKILVSKKSNIKTIQEAISVASNFNDAIIEIDEGIYKEKIKVFTNNITIIGKGIDKTIITFDDYSKKIHSDGRDYNTFRTSTMLITGNRCKIKDLTIENTSKSKLCGQAIALSVLGNHFHAENIKLKSEQDTLFLGPLPDDLKVRYTNFLSNDELFIEGSLYSKFIKCEIEGNIDFIFGSGSSLFDNCNIMSVSDGYVIAPSHSLYQDWGFIFNNCTFTKKNENINNVCLIRLWRPYGKAHFLNCKYDSHIGEYGLQGWNNKNPDVFTRIYEYPLNTDRVPYIQSLTKEEYNDILNLIDIKFNF